MKFETVKIEFEKIKTFDVIATSFEEETTVSHIEPSIKNDPYENDKW